MIEVLEVIKGKYIAALVVAGVICIRIVFKRSYNRKLLENQNIRRKKFLNLVHLALYTLVYTSVIILTYLIYLDIPESFKLLSFFFIVMVVTAAFPKFLYGISSVGKEHPKTQSHIITSLVYERRRIKIGGKI
jgi:cytochrome b561